MLAIRARSGLSRLAATRTVNVDVNIGVRHASTTTESPDKPEPVLGEKIYIFNQIQTNQVVYSLTRALNNNAAISQLPYNGKKTVPRALRKDLWLPLATISFAPGAGDTGLSTFQKLREYRRIHELQWGDEIRLSEEGKVETRKTRGRKIMNQKANTIADVATVLSKIGTVEGAEIGLSAPVLDQKALRTWIAEKAQSTADHVANHGAAEEQQILAKKAKKRDLTSRYWKYKGADVQSLTRVQIHWDNITDAEFAESWSSNVTHAQLERRKNNRSTLQERRRKVFDRTQEQLEEAQNNVDSADIDVVVERQVTRQGKPLTEEDIKKQLEKYATYLEQSGQPEEERQSLFEARRLRLGEKMASSPRVAASGITQSIGAAIGQLSNSRQALSQTAHLGQSTRPFSTSIFRQYVSFRSEQLPQTLASTIETDVLTGRGDIKKPQRS